MKLILNKNELKMGIKIEAEHQDIYDLIKDDYLPSFPPFSERDFFCYDSKSSY